MRERRTVRGMRRQRKARRTYSKRTGLIWVCVALIAVGIGAVVMKCATAFMVGSLYLIVLAPILVRRYKYDTDLGTMMISGLIRTGIWLGIWVGMAFLSRSSDLAAKISLWPISPA